MGRPWAGAGDSPALDGGRGRAGPGRGPGRGPTLVGRGTVACARGTNPLHTPTSGYGWVLVLACHYHLPHKEVKLKKCFLSYETLNWE